MSDSEYSDSDSEAEREYWDEVCREREELKRLELERAKEAAEAQKQTEIKSLHPNHQSLLKFYDTIIPIINANKDNLFYSNSLKIKGNMLHTLNEAAAQLKKQKIEFWKQKGSFFR